ncbi:hypothetical protein QYF61_014339 [Mycteria americana]|uniref:Uncharacterized protein n=1 Tax=Mycteria americana TaxID=33587 RepID=A0AAN7MYL4_MYCAM|nr:hypothetical protein QYF61_014339 [Mycteria americana]
MFRVLTLLFTCPVPLKIENSTRAWSLQPRLSPVLTSPISSSALVINRSSSASPLVRISITCTKKLSSMHSNCSSTRPFRPSGKSPVQSPAQSRPGHGVRPGFGALSWGGWEPPKEGDGTISLGLAPLPGCPHGEKPFSYIQPLWPCTARRPPGPRAFCPKLPPTPPGSLLGLCLPGAGLPFAPAPSAWGPCPFLPPVQVPLDSHPALVHVDWSPQFGVTCTPDRGTWSPSQVTDRNVKQDRPQADLVGPHGAPVSRQTWPSDHHL